MDFSPILDNGVEIPTYDQTTITHTAKVFTGFTWSDAPIAPPNFFGGGLTFAAQYAPMECFGTEWFPASGSGSNNMALVGTEIWVARSALPKAKPGEYYWCDLEGLEVVTVEGRSLGTVSHLIATGANDVLVAKDAERERLIPFLLGQFVTEVDLEGGRVTVDWDPEF